MIDVCAHCGGRIERRGTGFGVSERCLGCGKSRTQAVQGASMRAVNLDDAQDTGREIDQAEYERICGDN